MSNTSEKFIPLEREESVLSRKAAGTVDWQASYSPYGQPLGVCLSALIKLMRTCEWRKACWFGHQLFISGREVENWTWLHLRTFVVEDIGPAAPQAAVVLEALFRTYFDTKPKTERRWLIGFWAVRYLAQCPKNRSNDEAYAAMIIKLREGEPGPEVPDRAYDYHIKEGKDKGRGHLHFYQEATILRNTCLSQTTEDLTFLIERAKRLEESVKK